MRVALRVGGGCGRVGLVATIGTNLSEDSDGVLGRTTKSVPCPQTVRSLGTLFAGYAFVVMDETEEKWNGVECKSE